MEPGVQFFDNPLAHGLLVAHPDQSVNLDVFFPFGKGGVVNDAFPSIV